MSLFGIQAAVDKFLIILLDITHVCHLQEVITGIHLHTNRIQGLHHFGYIRDNRFATVGQLGEKMILDYRVDTEFNFFRVDQHELQFSRMLLI